MSVQDTRRVASRRPADNLELAAARADRGPDVREISRGQPTGLVASTEAGTRGRWSCPAIQCGEHDGQLGSLLQR